MIIGRMQPKHNVTSVYSASTPLEELENKSLLGDADAMYWLAYRLYFEGEDDLDEEHCKEWLIKASQCGNSFAKAKLGEWYGVSIGEIVSNVNENLTINADPCLQTLFQTYDSVIFFDLETNGLNPVNDQIIEIAALKVASYDNVLSVVDEMDELIALPHNQMLKSNIVEITGITDEVLRRAGKNKDYVYKRWLKFLGNERTLMVAYNAKFDLGFLHSLMAENCDEKLFSELDWLDAMSVYKDRRDYPHKLENAIDAYGLSNNVKNSHKAVDDTYSLFEVTKAMDIELDDLENYINLFGYNPKYGVNGIRYQKIKYVAQPYNNYRKIYQM